VAWHFSTEVLLASTSPSPESHPGACLLPPLTCSRGASGLEARRR